MNPDTKLILDELTKRFDDLESRIESRVAEQDDKWERRFGDLSISQEARIAAVERVAASLEEWRPEIDATVDDIRLDVGKLNKHWERAVRARSPPLLPTSTPAAERPFAPSNANRPNGHHEASNHREDGYGLVTTILHPPVKGASPVPLPPVPSPTSCTVCFPHDSTSGFRSSGGSFSSTGKIPKLNFPAFDGDNPKLWISRAQDYFELCPVESSAWIKVATVHFTHSAGRWLPSVQNQLKTCSWSQFCQLVLGRFGHDQHALLVRQLLSIRQTATVLEYVEQFSGLVDQLAAYEGAPDPLHYTMCFIDGLRDELKAAVLIQRPSDLDTAYVLASLQEEVTTPSRKRDSRRHDFIYPHKQDVPAPLPLPAPPRLTRPPDDKRAPEAGCGSDADSSRSAGERWSSLKAYRRAQGLCQYCAKKWSRDHRCADKVQLNVLHELLEVFQDSDEQPALGSESSPPDTQLFLTLSVAAVSGLHSPRTMCLRGAIQGHQVQILVDSGMATLIHLSVNSWLVNYLVFSPLILLFQSKLLMALYCTVQVSSLLLHGLLMPMSSSLTLRFFPYILMT